MNEKGCRTARSKRVSGRLIKRRVLLGTTRGENGTRAVPRIGGSLLLAGPSPLFQVRRRLCEGREERKKEMVVQ
jgi:hypothetical protein